MIRWNPDGTPDLDDDGSPQRSGRTRTVRADRLSSDSKKDAEEHRKTERSDRVVIQSLVVGPGWQVERPTPPGETPTGIKARVGGVFCSSPFIWYVALLVPGCGGEVASWTLVVGWLQANWAWAANVVLRPRIPLSFSWTGLGCVFSRIFLTGGCRPSFSELETYFGLALSSQLSRPVQSTLSRWQYALVSLEVPGRPRVPQPGVTVESGKDRVVRRVPRREAKTEQ